MVKLLQKNVVKSIFLALSLFVLFTLTFMSGAKDAIAQTTPDFASLFTATWNPGSFQIGEAAAKLDGDIKIQENGGLYIEDDVELPRNSFHRFSDSPQDYVTIRGQDDNSEDYFVGFFVKITGPTEQSSTPVTIIIPNGTVIDPGQQTAEIGVLELERITGQPSLSTQKSTFTKGDLIPGAEYSVQFFGVAKEQSSAGSAQTPPTFRIIETFPIGETETFQTFAIGEAPEGSLVATGFTDNKGLTGFEQALTGFSCGVTTLLTNCMIHFLYGIVYSTTAALLRLAGETFDFFLSFAISSKVYRDSTFAITGWAIIRDISNVFFIFVLLIAAFKTMLGSGDAQKTIKNVIVTALLINFSLFMVRVVIDASNITAHIFYNRIASIGQDGQPIPEGIEVNGIQPPRQISLGIGEGLSLQNFIGGPGVQAFFNEMGSSGASSLSTYATIIIFGIIINVTAAWMFFQVGLMMLARIIGLWLAMVLAPLAFMTKLIPGAGKFLGGMGFESWSSDLTKNALLAPVFLFFVYLIILFINSDFVGDFLNPNNYTSFEKIIALSLSFLMVLGMLKMATETAKGLSGRAGQMFADYGSKALGLAVGVAGGAAMATGGFALRQTAGRALKALGDNEGLKDAEAQGGAKGWLAGKTRQFGKYGGSASFDARSGVIGSATTSALSQIGLKADFDNKVLNTASFGTASTKASEGGFQKARDEASKERIEKAKDLKIGPDSAISLDVNKKQKEFDAQQAEIERLKDAGLADDDERVKEAIKKAKEAKDILAKAKLEKKETERKRTLKYADSVEGEVSMKFRTGEKETAQKIRDSVSESTALADIEKRLKEKEAEDLKETREKARIAREEALLEATRGKSPTAPKPIAGLDPSSRKSAGLPTANTSAQPAPGILPNNNKVNQVSGQVTQMPGGINIQSGSNQQRNTVTGFGQNLNQEKGERTPIGFKRTTDDSAKEEPLRGGDKTEEKRSSAPERSREKEDPKARFDIRDTDAKNLGEKTTRTEYKTIQTPVDQKTETPPPTAMPDMSGIEGGISRANDSLSDLSKAIREATESNQDMLENLGSNFSDSLEKQSEDNKQSFEDLGITMEDSINNQSEQQEKRDSDAEELLRRIQESTSETSGGVDELKQNEQQKRDDELWRNPNNS